MIYLQSYYTDIGTSRKTNQDSLALVKAQTDLGEVLLAAVCDGMGGHAAGELASKYCVKRLCAWFRQRFPVLLYDGRDLSGLLQEELSALVREVNERLASYGDREKLGMGSTLTAFLFASDAYYAIHVGDSRGCEITEGVRQITKDQSVVAEKVRQGLLTEEEARHQKNNVLLESVGVTHTVHPEFYSGRVVPDCCYLLCSDGFWHHLKQEEYVRYLDGRQLRDNRQIRMHLNFLTETVKSRGERDNISCVAVIPIAEENGYGKDLRAGG